MARVDTVAIANRDATDYIIINRVDFDPDHQQIWHGPEPVPPRSPPPQPEPDADTVSDAAISDRAKELSDNHTVPELQDLAEPLNIEGVSTMRKAELARAIALAELS